MSIPVEDDGIRKLLIVLSAGSLPASAFLNGDGTLVSKSNLLSLLLDLRKAGKKLKGDVNALVEAAMLKERESDLPQVCSARKNVLSKIQRTPNLPIYRMQVLQKMSRLTVLHFFNWCGKERDIQNIEYAICHYPSTFDKMKKYLQRSIPFMLTLAIPVLYYASTAEKTIHISDLRQFQRFLDDYQWSISWVLRFAYDKRKFALHFHPDKCAGKKGVENFFEEYGKRTRYNVVIDYSSVNYGDLCQRMFAKFSSRFL